MFAFHFQELLRKNKVVIVDINTCVLPEDEPSLTNTKYFIHKLIDSASTKFRSYIRAHFTVIMPTIVSCKQIDSFNSRGLNIYIDWYFQSVIV